MKHPRNLVLAFLFSTVAVASAAGPESLVVSTTKALTLTGAKQIVAAGVAEARRADAGGALAVVDAGGHLLYLERLDGTFPAAATVAIEKARTAAVFRRETHAFEEAIRGGRVSLTAVSVMTPLEGGVPIVIDGVVVGAIGVSGARSSRQDDEIAKLAAAALN